MSGVVCLGYKHPVITHWRSSFQLTLTCCLYYYPLIKLILSVVPEFMKRPTDRVVIEGQNVTFSCEVNGIPEPLIKWNFNGGSLPEHRIENGTLTLYEVKNTVSFEGRYTCSALSRAGFISTNVSLVVDGESFTCRVNVFTCCDLLH